MLAGARKFRDSSNPGDGVNLAERDHDLTDYLAGAIRAVARLGSE